jgi:hypothetical protein
VMQNDEERGKEHIAILSSPGVEAAAEAVLAKLVEPLTDGASAPALHLEL